MATFNLSPQTLTNPDQGGTVAYSGATTAGHASEAASCSVFKAFGFDSSAQSKSVRWSNFQSAPGGTITSLHLKFDWNVSGSVSASSGDTGSGNASASYSLQYSLDGGSNWTNLSSRAASCDQSSASASFSDSASTDVTLLTSQNIANVRVRELATSAVDCFADDSGPAFASASVTSTVTSVRLVLVTSDPPAAEQAGMIMML